jgi:WD40 repeat protein
MSAQRTRRSGAGKLLLAVFAVALVGWGAWWLTRDLDNSAAWAGVTSLLCGLVQVLLSAADHLRRRERMRPDVDALAENLAQIISEQWLGEVNARQLRDPSVLPLSWSNVGDGTTQSSGRLLRSQPDGRMDGRFDDVLGQLADRYSGIPSRRLVVLGEPGAGKTVLAILLTLGLLRRRSAGAPVPVLLAVSSWDPVRKRLDDWVVDTLADGYYGGQPDIPRRLMEHRLLVPVLDGLDEIPESARRGAVRALNHALGADRPVVVTCRTAEYVELFTDGAPTLRRAPVVRVLRVPADEVVRYLSRVDWPAGTEWEAVYADVRGDPDGPVASAFSTPLMLALARTVYQRLGGDPAELLDRGRFDCRHAVEDNLTDRVIDAAYAPDRLPSGELASADRPRWTAARARAWLTFLAVYLHQHRERDLVWWLLSQRLLSVWIAPAIAIVGGGAIMALVSVTSTIGAESVVSDEAITVGAAAGLMFAILAVVIWFTAAGRAPGRLVFEVRGSLDRLGQGFRTGASLLLVLAVPALLVSAVTFSIDGWNYSAIDSFLVALSVTAATAGVVGTALAVHNLLDAPPALAAQASPLGFVRQDRRSSLVGAVLAGTVTGLLIFPALFAAVLVGSLSAQWLTGWSGWPGRPNVSATASKLWTGASGDVLDLGVSTALATSLVGALLGTTFALLVLLSRAWPRFVVARMVMAARGQLPLRLLGFLADARDRQLLRQSGGAYQFRHVRLQERLADRTVAADGPSPRPAGAAQRSGSARIRRAALVVAGVAVLSASIVAVVGIPQDSSRRTLTGHRAPVNAVAFRPGGHSVATGDTDGSVRLWDTTTGDLLRTATIGAGTVAGITFSSTGQTMAVSADADTVQLLQAETLVPLVELKGTVAFSPDGRLAAAASGDGTVQLWDVVANTLVRNLDGPTGEVDVVAFSPDPQRRLLAVGDSDATSDTVRLWDVGTGLLTGRLSRSREFVPTGSHTADDVAFSPDGGRTVTTVGLDGTVRVWDTGDNHLIRTLRTPAGVSDTALSPGGQIIAIVDVGADTDTDNDDTVALWNTVTDHQIDTLHTSTDSMQFSPDGQILMTGAGCSDAANLWYAATGEQIIGSYEETCDVHLYGFFSPDSRRLAVVNGETVTLVSTATGKTIATLHGHSEQVNTIDFSADGSMVTGSDDRTARLWNPPGSR